MCPRHPDRVTGLRCTRCGRPACPECLREASVGYQCVDCVADGRRDVRRAVTVAGAEVRQRPLVVPVLILLNVVVFAWTAVQAGSIADNSASPLFSRWALWPPAVAGDQWWRVVTSGFLHIGPVHLVLNMIALWVLGRDLEIILGRLRFLAVYLVSLLGGSAAVFLFGDTRVPVAGASGAVFGLMGGIAVAVIRLRLDPRPALTVIGLNVVLSIVVPGVSLLGHLGGLVVGAVASAGMVYAPARRRGLVQSGVLVGLLVALAVVFVLRDASFGGMECFEVDGEPYCVHTD
ncbi:Membrane associated serine protease, rhomboid family [Streptoalloteichus tenebrarius]|uniref:Membrane associated serine protease, rhomboid family n=1 Tax=Streptoalloteichus tenebrarius (strain ATCC 17920 / DSM 40477 / JCM 4838 / CBS 697.72 / NBRC 16177 / NCIMB 11028 / NRRL B-12390 / A12253. 1 / ISP 5477) TaxID=1933 RepID=A0ABT1I2W8_STRSD|nr:Membrane associated serine protease, rhomboid family [Streptoalloteichus tenebrarius]